MVSDQTDQSKVKPMPTARKKTRSRLICAVGARDPSRSGGEGGEKTGGLGGSPEKEQAKFHTSSPIHETAAGAHLSDPLEGLSPGQGAGHRHSSGAYGKNPAIQCEKRAHLSH